MGLTLHDHVVVEVDGEFRAGRIIRAAPGGTLRAGFFRVAPDWDHRQAVNVPIAKIRGPFVDADEAHRVCGVLRELEPRIPKPDENPSLAAETVRRYRNLFGLVCAPMDWKAPLEAIVPPGVDLDALAEAIKFFTATTAVFRTIRGGVIVNAAGYRAGPAGDH